MSEILVMGSSNIDYTIKLNRLPKKGETIGDGETNRADGGKGANQAIAAARAGGKVIFSCCIGNNFVADSRIFKFKTEGLETKYIFKIDNVESGSAFILVGSDGDNMIAVAPGANYKFSRELADSALPAIQSAGYILLQFEIPMDTVKYIIDLAAQHHKKVILNTAPAKMIEDTYLKNIHVLVVNETEAALLAEIPSVGTSSQARSAGEILISKGPEFVIITRGTNGSLIVNKDKSIEEIPAYKVEGVDATAAGDTFCGTLTVGLSQGKSISDAVRFATAASAIAVTKMGAQTSIPKLDEIQQFMSRNSL